ncbi:hypothetical protein [Nibrella saemangeumensis]
MTVSQTLNLVTPLKKALEASNPNTAIEVKHRGTDPKEILIEITSGAETDLEALFTIPQTGYRIVNLFMMRTAEGLKGFIAVDLD